MHLKHLVAWRGNTRLFAAFAAVAANCFWIVTLTRCPFSLEYLPWSVVLLGISVASLSVFRPEHNKPTSFSFMRLRHESGFSLTNSLAFTYSVLSIAIGLLLLQVKPFPWQPLESRQFIDIEFTSSADFENKNELLPSTEPKQNLRKRLGSLVDTVGNVPKQQAPSQITEPVKLQKRNDSKGSNQTIARFSSRKTAKLRDAVEEPLFVITEQPKPAEMRTPRPSSKEVPWSATPTFVSHRVSTSHSAESLQMEEVAPAKLLEVTDNDGDTGNELWQAGGRSTGGKGARSVLANYLKELHKRLKRAWSPPAETSSGKAEILFRLRRDGELCSIKLATSSGDPAVDQSALIAISKCAPYNHLPDDYTQQFLDLRYTFTYTADELKAVDNLSIKETEQ